MYCDQRQNVRCWWDNQNPLWWDQVFANYAVASWSCEFQVARCEFQVASCDFWIAGRWLEMQVPPSWSKVKLSVSLSLWYTNNPIMQVGFGSLTVAWLTGFICISTFSYFRPICYFQFKFLYYKQENEL